MLVVSSNLRRSAVLEGLIRLAIFIGYVAAISLMPDIKRVYMYHGAEHKCINCIEHGMDLTVEKECGSVLDLNVTGLDHINVLAAQDFDGEIEGHVTYFYGKCSSCKAKRQTS